MRDYDRLASVGTLAAGYAHEIKNALVPVKTFVDLLVSQNPKAELADVVQRELRRIDSLVSQMLKFAGPAKPTFTPVHLHKILDHSLRLIQFRLDGKKIELHREFSAGPDSVPGDAYQLEQAFTNLLINAFEAMNEGGRLLVATSLVSPNTPQHALPHCAEQTLVQVQIRDTGMGIPPENLSRLFDTFFTTKPTGTGLGLTITRRIIHEHRGTISVESTLGKGTTFTVLLPSSHP